MREKTPELAALTSTGVAGVDWRRILPREVRAVENKPGRVHSYAAIWGDETRPDWYGTWFTRETDFALDWFDKRPWLYAHAGNPFVGGAKIGEWRDADLDDYGLFFIGELEERFRYLDEVEFLMEIGYLFPSSGTLSYAARIADSGWIERWPIVELSSTVAPAEFRIPAQQLDASRRRQAAQAIRKLGGATMSEDTNVLATLVPGVNLAPPPQEPAAHVRDASELDPSGTEPVGEQLDASADPAPGEEDAEESLPEEAVTGIDEEQLRGLLERADEQQRALRAELQSLREEVQALREQQPTAVEAARALVDEPTSWMEQLFTASRDGQPLTPPEGTPEGEPYPEDGGVLGQLGTLGAGQDTTNDVFLSILNSQRRP